MPNSAVLEPIQHINVKLFALAPAPEQVLDAAIPVFHRWIQNAACPELLIDVADYRHVPDGPGVILIGHEANYGLDCEAGLLGLLYNRKARSEGSFEERLRLSYERALQAARMLEREPEFAGILKFDPASLEVVVNDRLLAPNTEETWRLLKPPMQTVFGEMLGERAFTLDWASADPRERFRVRVDASAAVSEPKTAA
ncbi:MAG: hypothetical protein K6T61_06340 [Bryobacteraceae bacterium]|nr:hypothetical protein [Bryobacteraceae bacterium]